MELGLALTLCGLGAGFLIPACIITGISEGRKKKCTEDTTALVIQVKRRRTEHGTSYHPVYEYYVDNVRYLGEGAYISGKVPEKNTFINIKYNPRKPGQSYIQGYDNKVYRILSSVFMVMGLIPILVCLGIWIWG